MPYNNIDIKGIKKDRPKLKCKGEILPFLKDKEYFSDLERKNSFIKQCESMIRTNSKYKTYKSHLHSLGLNYCVKHPNIKLEEDTITKGGSLLEMHHGPLLTLYDYCNIIINALLARDERVTTFRVADIILEEHYLNNIQVVMLCNNCHDLNHDSSGASYINPKQAYGSFNRFIKKWDDGIDNEMRKEINNNLEISRKYFSADDEDCVELSGCKEWE